MTYAILAATQTNKTMNTNRYEEHYYYARDNKPNNPGKHPLACVCIIKDKTTGKMHRGISICSTNEKSFNKDTARGIAFQRALNASRLDATSYVKFTKSTSLAILALAKYGINYGDGFVAVSVPDAKLTEFEEKVCDDHH